MLQWFVITHNLHALQLVKARIAGLGAVEIYSPEKVELKKRRDCNGVRPKVTPMFPGYLFLRFDPEVVHTTTISDIPGVQDFVRTGVTISTVRNGVVEALKQSLLLRADRKVISLECKNVPAATLATIESIVVMKSLQERQVALFALLQNDAQLHSSAVRNCGRIYSVTEKVPVNEKLY
ncbi:transcription termination/antitermination NusG family protein [Pseudomonas mosselii]|uniref:transcription termination/antitermination NusG family protein n=1 Tax=Pseudomonas mosselii TaxID=78327 RepID=UPI0026393956|nr:transcription termination/antitermination NusG family protein [Pseudomonas mosselii]MDN4500150.1 transcription termination/antitermination NusG family protein [Pseudomonas mosselii]